MNHFLNKKKYPKNNGGFLLVELIVSVFLFALFMTISIGSIISLLDANKKTQSLKSVMDNLNLAMDSMTKEIAVGKKYSGGGDTITFLSNEDINGNGIADDFITYAFSPNPGAGNIQRSISTMNNGQFIAMTASEVNITKAHFFISGTATFNESPPHDTYQPKIILWIDGTTKVAPRGTESSFHIQTEVTQRVPDNVTNQ